MSHARHRALRWVGVPLFWLGAAGFVTALGMAVAADGRWSTALLYVAATGLSLATFGTHNDTAIALMVRSETLPDPARQELDQELERDRVGTLTLSPSPRTALVITLVAIGLHTLGALRLLG